MEASKFLETSSPKKGYIVMKSEQVPDLTSGESDTFKELTTYDEFHPVLFNQHKNQSYKEFDTFDQVNWPIVFSPFQIANQNNK